MRISQFFLSLNRYYEGDFLYANPEQEIYAFKPAPERSETVRWEENVLYISTEHGVPASCPDRFSMLLLAEDPKECLSGLRQAFPLANLISVKWLRENTLPAFYDTVTDIFLAESRYTAQVNRLSSISSSNRGMQALIDEAARLLGAAVVVIDTSYRVLAMSEAEFPEDESRMEEQRQIGVLTERNLRRMRRDHIFEQIRRQPDRMVYSLAPDARYWWANLLVYVHGVEVAEAGIMEYRRKFTEADFELIKYLRYLISLEIQRLRAFDESRSIAHSLLVAELLEQSVPNPEVIRYRASLLGWQTAPYYRVFSVFRAADQPRQAGHFHRQGEILAAQISQLLSRSHWYAGEEDLNFLIPCQERNDAVFSDSPRLSRLLEGCHMIGILSNPAPSLMEVRRAYLQVKALYRMREYLPGDVSLYRYQDHSILHIGAVLCQNHDLEAFYHPYVLAIRDHDRQYHTDFLNTLREYLTYVDNPSLIARHLNIHKNTLYYRMNKLKEMFPIDLNDGNLRFRLQLTMELMRLEQGRGGM